VGTHQDVSNELVRAGFDVETINVAEAVDAERLHKILNRRIDGARRGPGRIPRVTRKTAQTILRRFGGDVRAVIGHMYDLFQQLGEVRNV
jgi:hypothetical protein